MTDQTPEPDDRNDAREARVQVLTAEVRTLVVGSRQVTMSVYAQLDSVAYDEIEPFGRVSHKDAVWWRTYVVGRHKYEGTLVRSWTLSLKALDVLKERGALTGDRGFPFVPSIWRDTDTKELSDLAWDWAELPLIVLAGLR